MSKIICADAAAGLKSLPPDSVRMCVTSPPYYGLRDYGADGQIGIEQTTQEYIARLVEVFAEVYRVLKPDGTLWLNIGDMYSNRTRGNSQAKRPYRHTVDACIRAPRARLVSQIGHHLA